MYLGKQTTQNVLNNDGLGSGAGGGTGGVLPNSAKGFHARLSGNYDPSVSESNIPFDIVDVNVGGLFDITQNGMVAKEAGLHFLSVNLSFEGGAGGDDTLELMFRVNGVNDTGTRVFDNPEFQTSTGREYVSNYTAILDLEIGDLVQARLFSFNTGTDVVILRHSTFVGFKVAGTFGHAPVIDGVDLPANPTWNGSAVPSFSTQDGKYSAVGSYVSGYFTGVLNSGLSADTVRMDATDFFGLGAIDESKLPDIGSEDTEERAAIGVGYIRDNTSANVIYNFIAYYRDDDEAVYFWFTDNGSIDRWTESNPVAVASGDVFHFHFFNVPIEGLRAGIEPDNSALTLAERIEIGPATDTITFDTSRLGDRAYQIHLFILNDDLSASTYELFVNGDTTSTNYNSTKRTNDGSTQAVSAPNTAEIAEANVASNYAEFIIDLRTFVNGAFSVRSVGQKSVSTGSSADVSIDYSMRKTSLLSGPAPTIDQLQLKASQAGGFGTNTVALLYTRHQTTGAQLGAVATIGTASDITAERVPDLFVGVDTTGGPVTVTASLSPSEGDRVTVKDEGGAAGTDAITFDGNGNNVDGAASDTIVTDNGSKTYIFRGGEWRIT